MKNPKKPILALESAHDVHGFLDFMLVETVHEGKSLSRWISIPYNKIAKEDPDYAGAVVIVEISTYWDAELTKDEATKRPKGDKSTIKH